MKNFVYVQFVDSWLMIAQKVHKCAEEKGFWDKECNDGEIIALIHSELSEALEGLRRGNPPDDKIPEFSSVEAELADAVIRILGFAYARGHDVGNAIVAKMEYNKTRPYKYGKEF